MKVKAWTIERPTMKDGRPAVLIDDIKLVKSEAIAEVERRGLPWGSCEIELDIPTALDPQEESDDDPE